MSDFLPDEVAPVSEAIRAAAIRALIDRDDTCPTQDR